MNKNQTPTPTASEAPITKKTVNTPNQEVNLDDAEEHKEQKKQGCCCCWCFVGYCGGLLLVVIVSLAIFFSFRGLGPVGWIAGAINSISGASSGCTTGKISQSDLNLIIKNKPVYQKAADIVGIPWEILAALHLRESGLSNFEAKDGPFQVRKSKLLYFNEASATEAAFHIKGAVKDVYKKKLTKTSNEETIKLAFLAYNRGYMYKNNGCTWDQSPYVMNQFDAAHKNMVWPNNACEAESVRGQRDVPAGAYTIYAILTGKISGSESCTAVSSSVSTGGCKGVIQQAEKYLNRGIKYRPDPSPYPHCGYNTYGPENVIMIDCSGYTSRVYHDLGLTKGNWCYHTAIIPTARQLLLVTGDREAAKSLMQPGDLILIQGHVVIFGGRTSNGRNIIYESTPRRIFFRGGPVKRIYPDYIDKYKSRFLGVYRARSCK